MKKLIILFLLVFFTMGFSKNINIENPKYEFKNTGLYNITKIETDKGETRLYLHITFIPGWWVQFSETTFIQNPESGEKFHLQSIIGTELSKKTPMPVSGDTNFILIFPPLPPNIQTINFGEDNRINIYGISLDKKANKANNSQKETPEYVINWINDEIGKAKIKTPVDLNSEDFFRKDTARLIGYIKGYDERAGFKTGIIYTENVITWEDISTVIEIHPDGRFEGIIPMSHPKILSLNLNRTFLDFYIEPGQTLACIMDWDEFLISDQKRNVRYNLKNTTFKGSLTELNNELKTIELSSYDYRNLENKIKELTAIEFKKQSNEIYLKDKKNIENHLEKGSISSKAANLLSNEAIINYGTYLFDYTMRKSIYQLKDSTNNPILALPTPDIFMDFLREIPMDDPHILTASGISTFINRFEFNEYYKTVNDLLKKQTVAVKSFEDFLIEDKGMGTTGKRLKEFISIYNMRHNNQNINAIDPQREKIFDTYFDEYNKTYIKNIFTNRPLFESEKWRLRDSLMINKLKLEPNMINNICKIRSLKSIYKHENKDISEACLIALTSDITSIPLLKECIYMFEKAFPEKKDPYVLPEGKGTEIFCNIIEQYKGKILFVDFWAITCAPCVAGIRKQKEFREKNENNPDFDFIFITDQAQSPETAYNKFIEEQNLKNSHRISSDEYQYLRQLFKFNGIPRYIIVDKNGRIYNDNFDMHNIELRLEKILEDLR